MTLRSSRSWALRGTVNVENGHQVAMKHASTADLKSLPDKPRFDQGLRIDKAVLVPVTFRSS